MTSRLVFTRHARRGANKLADSGLRPKAENLLEFLCNNLYQVLDEEQVVKVIRMWTHYE